MSKSNETGVLEIGNYLVEAIKLSKGFRKSISCFAEDAWIQRYRWYYSYANWNVRLPPVCICFLFFADKAGIPEEIVL